MGAAAAGSRSAARQGRGRADSAPPTDVEVERLTKKGLRRFDAREAVLSLGYSRELRQQQVRASSQPCAYFAWLYGTSTPAVRPDDVLTGLRLVADFAPPVPPEVTRLAQGPLDAAPVSPPIRSTWTATLRAAAKRDRLGRHVGGDL